MDRSVLDLIEVYFYSPSLRKMEWGQTPKFRKKLH